MHISTLYGSVPGLVQAVVSHDGKTMVEAMELACHDGAWIARSGRGPWSARSATPLTAALLNAAEAVCTHASSTPCVQTGPVWTGRFDDMNQDRLG